MYDWELRDLRNRAEAGEHLAAAEMAQVFDALDQARRAATVPTEYVVRVARSTDDLDRWTADHPLLRSVRPAEHPADALAFASVELRRVLAGRDFPEPDRSEWLRSAVSRALADAHRSSAGADVAAVIGWALDELDRVTSELSVCRYGRELQKASQAGDASARAALHERAVARLTGANVRASAHEWWTTGSATPRRLVLRCRVLPSQCRCRSVDRSATRSRRGASRLNARGTRSAIARSPGR